MADIGRVAKGGHNEKQNYDYTKADDIISEVRAALVKHAIVFLSSEESQERLPDRESRNGGAILGVVVKMKFTLLDTTSDEKMEAFHSGEGMDSGDKAVNKAKTAALKYFLQQTFLIPTGDDPEKDDHDIKTTRKPDNAGVRPPNGKPNPYMGGGDGEPVSAGQLQLLDISGERKLGTGYSKWLENRLAEIHSSRKTLSKPHFQMLVNELADMGRDDGSQEPPPEEDPFA